MKKHLKINQGHATKHHSVGRGDNYLDDMRVREKYLSIGIQSLIIIIAVALMLIIINVLLKI